MDPTRRDPEHSDEIALLRMVTLSTEEGCGKCRNYGHPQKTRMPTVAWKAQNAFHTFHSLSGG